MTTNRESRRVGRLAAGGWVGLGLEGGSGAAPASGLMTGLRR